MNNTDNATQGTDALFRAAVGDHSAGKFNELWDHAAGLARDLANERKLTAALLLSWRALDGEKSTLQRALVAAKRDIMNRATARVTVSGIDAALAEVTCQHLFGHYGFRCQKCGYDARPDMAQVRP